MPFDPNARLDQYDAEIETLEKEFIANVKRLTQMPGLKVKDLTLFLTQYDFFNTLTEMGYQGKATAFMNDWNPQILQLLNLSDAMNVEQVARVNISDLDTVRRLEFDRLLRRGRDYADEVRGELLKSLMNGSDILDIQKQVLPRIQQEMKFYPSWFNSMLNTAYSEYNAVGLKKLTEDLPQVRFILRGPLDPNNRKQCRHALTVMKKYPEGLTAQQINEEKLLGAYKTKEGEQVYDMQKRGGFNCRHYFEAVPESFTEEE